MSDLMCSDYERARKNREMIANGEKSDNYRRKMKFDDSVLPQVTVNAYTLKAINSYYNNMTVGQIRT